MFHKIKQQDGKEETGFLTERLQKRKTEISSVVTKNIIGHDKQTKPPPTQS